MMIGNQSTVLWWYSGGKWCQNWEDGSNITHQFHRELLPHLFPRWGDWLWLTEVIPEYQMEKIKVFVRYRNEKTVEKFHWWIVGLEHNRGRPKRAWCLFMLLSGHEKLLLHVLCLKKKVNWFRTKFYVLIDQLFGCTVYFVTSLTVTLDDILCDDYMCAQATSPCASWCFLDPVSVQF